MKNEKKTLTERISWIDICRGIAILFVMYAHILPSDSYRYIFYSFHMPLFFFLSGIVFKEKFSSYWTVVKKSFLTIMVPYFMFAALTYLFWFFKEHTTHNTLGDLQTQLIGILYGSSANGYLYFNVALWFLPCLFITRIGFAALIKLTKRTDMLIAILTACSIIGYVFATYYADVMLPFGFEIAFSAIVFFGAGFLLKRNASIFQKVQKHGVVVFTAGLLLTVLFASCNFYLFGDQIDMRVNRINNYFFFYAAAFSGILSWIACSMVIGKSYLLEYIGKHTLVLFAWHYLLYSYFTDIITFLLSPETLTAIQLIKPTLYTFFAVGIILIVTKIIRELKFNYLYQQQKRK